jgi:hypothetical protein
VYDIERDSFKDYKPQIENLAPTHNRTRYSLSIDGGIRRGSIFEFEYKLIPTLSNYELLINNMFS